MSNYKTNSLDPTYEQVLMVVQKCEAMCEHTLTMINRMEDCRQRTRQMQLLRDCIDVCSLTAKYIARYSMYARSMAGQCAMICEDCGNECLRFTDNFSRHCGYVCLDCARECRKFAQMCHQYGDDC